MTISTSPSTTLVEFRPLVGQSRRIHVNGEQLHGRRCVDCNGADGKLVPAGHVYTDAGEGASPYGWPVVVHSEHLAAGQ
ncbi:hypothetical protein GCM10010193_70860 [Kitasatospora atroaurantiaca]|uniref:Uncharacterized protein n=1 Tax=Kitasatospora atroaurantiaca TaxID=285545 RepID=A0A561ENG3_9ACTN|nr:hypothetical protein [Kitasatospora atroaurantiaca]TWE17171.1 hypothetical protein FB465_2178 [Kitasatospora atroaurantiaca]